MKKFNTAMQGIFVIIGIVGFIGMCGEPTDKANWFKVLGISLILFLVGFAGTMFFDDPAKYTRYILGAMYVSGAAIYQFCHETKEIFKLLYSFKKQCGTYRNMFATFKRNYYKQKSMHNDDDNSCVEYDTYNRRGAKR